MKLIECVPNVSEGKNREVIQALSAALESVQGLGLLHVDPNADANRTVFTFAGSPEVVIEGAFQLIRESLIKIDMREHKGAHPRIGAVDVCPFVPLAETSIDDCVQASKDLASRVWSELKLPVFFYEASSPEGKSLSSIRRGEFEGLAEKLRKPEWKVDVGESVPHESGGVLVSGARNLLVAYNVNLNSSDIGVAKEIASRIRTSGKLEGTAGLLKGCKAIGWLMPAYGCAQVSTNIVDLQICSLHEVFEACRDEARKLGVEVSGSELIGLVPEVFLAKSGRFYEPEAKVEDLCDIAIQHLNLKQYTNFKLEDRLLERQLERHFGQSLSL